MEITASIPQYELGYLQAEAERKADRSGRGINYELASPLEIISSTEVKIPGEQDLATDDEMTEEFVPKVDLLLLCLAGQWINTG